MVHRAVNGPMAPLARLLAMARAVAMMHQTAHWQTRGLQYYGDHQMFMRLYEQSQPAIDQMAERTVGAGTTALVGARQQIAAMKRVVDDLYPTKAAPGVEELIKISLAAEIAFVEELANVFAELDRDGKLSRGTSNLLEGVSDKHEEFVYLLRQRLAG